MTRQYLACKFRPGDVQNYTYHYDVPEGGEPLAVGDKVGVDSPRNEGRITIEVAQVLGHAPSFPTKPILGKVEM